MTLHTHHTTPGLSEQREGGRAASDARAPRAATHNWQRTTKQGLARARLLHTRLPRISVTFPSPGPALRADPPMMDHPSSSGSPLPAAAVTPGRASGSPCVRSLRPCAQRPPRAACSHSCSRPAWFWLDLTLLLALLHRPPTALALRPDFLVTRARGARPSARRKFLHLRSRFSGFSKRTFTAADATPWVLAMF